MIETSGILFCPVSLSSLEELIEKSVSNGIAKQLAISPPIEISKDQENQFLTRREAAKYLGISLVTLSDWSKSGVVTGYRIASRVRYKRNELENSLKKMKV